MFNYLRPAVTMLLLLTLLTGVVYPALVTILAQTFFPAQANGSLLTNAHGEAIGSSLIGQAFSDPKYFWGRPSATSPYANNAAASSGSNLGPTNPVLREKVAARIKALTAADPENKTPIPIDLVTSSASGLDPHISLAAAEYQLRRVAQQRKLDINKVRELVLQNTESRQWYILGEARVNVLQLNIALDNLTNQGQGHAI